MALRVIKVRFTNANGRLAQSSEYLNNEEVRDSPLALLSPLAPYLRRGTPQLLRNGFGLSQTQIAESRRICLNICFHNTLQPEMINGTLFPVKGTYNNFEFHYAQYITHVLFFTSSFPFILQSLL